MDAAGRGERGQRAKGGEKLETARLSKYFFAQVFRNADAAEFTACLFDGRQDALLVHDDAVAFVDRIISPHVVGRQIDGGQIRARVERAHVSVLGYKPHGTNGRDDPVRRAQSHPRHTIKGQIDVAAPSTDKRRLLAGYKGTHTATR